jgi:hypothetical protein
MSKVGPKVGPAQAPLDLVGAAEEQRRPILVLDFDGVLHSYASGWQGVDLIPDPPVPGFAEFLENAIKIFEVAVYSSRSRMPEGRQAMRDWLGLRLAEHYAAQGVGATRAQRAVNLVMKALQFPVDKPAAFVSLDDRAVTFTGKWPDPAELARFRPWWQH